MNEIKQSGTNESFARCCHTTHACPRRRRRTTALATTLAAAATTIASAAEAADLSVSSVTIVQSVQLGSTTLVGGRSAMVRVKVAVTGSSVALAGVDARLRTYVDGIEQTTSPSYSTNGPIVAQVSPNMAVLDDTINFTILVPVSGNVDFVVDLDPANTIVESNEGNNSSPLNNVVFACRDVVEVDFMDIDYTPGGGLPDPLLTEAGIGDNFVRAIFAPGELNYHEVPLPTLVWTQNINNSSTALLNTLHTMLTTQIPAAGYPKPDFIYGWLKGNPFSGNGKSNGIPGDSAFGNTDTTRFQRTFAHELGHLVGLSHNTATISTNGIDVEHDLLNTENLAQLFPSTKKDVMYAGQLTNAAFVNQASFNKFIADNRVQCPAGDSEGDGGGGAGGADGLLHIVGGYSHGAATGWIDPVFEAKRESLSIDNPAGDVAIVCRAADGTALWTVRIDTAIGREMCCEQPHGGQPIMEESQCLWAFVPRTVDGTLVASAEIVELATQKVLAQRSRSDNAPTAVIQSVGTVALQPEQAKDDGRGPAAMTGVVRVEWTASDPDGDALTHHLLYSRDEGGSWLPMGVNIVGGSLEFDASQVPATVGNSAWFKLVTSDGFDSVESPVMEGAALGAGSPPAVHLVSPNNIAMHRQHAPVLLHASAWDLEDLMLPDASIAWTSSIDGDLGTGREFILDTLSPGTHVITVTGVDTDGMSSSRSVTMSVVPRTVMGADLNLDGTVDGADLGVLLSGWGSALGDLSGDGMVDGTDLGIMLGAWMK